MPVKEPTTRKATAKSRKRNTQSGYQLRTHEQAEALRERLGLDAKSMARYLGIDEKTYSRRGQHGDLKGGESLKVDMLASVLEEATRVLRGEEEARHWITTPIISLEHKKPLEHLTSIDGYERVKNTLTKIEYGMY